MIRIENLHKTFGKLKVLNDLSTTFEAGECVALLGPNGCGKTTLIKSVLGMVLPEKGNIFFEDKNISKHTAYRQHIGYMPQIGKYPDNMQIGQVIDMIRNIRGAENEVDMDLFQKFEMDKLKSKKMRTLSGGTRQKVSATLAFMFQPKVLILDEPTAGLDPIASEILKEKIIAARDQKKLILITSHILSELEEVVNRVIYMQDGEIKFSKSVDALKEESGENSMAKAILQHLKSHSYVSNS